MMINKSLQLRWQPFMKLKFKNKKNLLFELTLSLHVLLDQGKVKIKMKKVFSKIEVL